ncbi:MAG: LLM class flavin-dependent oxidoreductase [Verrucomicrobiota bacterium]|nr:LLM class flavin-dependent oxidoreductase [Verrucomicrobiota bacterium]
MRYSVLDLCPIIDGGDAALAFRHAVDLAQHVERWGYHRYWLAEHHNLPGIASAATSVVIAHVADATKTIRVGAGGIMLSNHAPLVIAEQFGTLASMFPGRIDLGLGRAPGSDQLTARAIRRFPGGDHFPEELAELRSYFEPVAPQQRLRAVPGAGLDIPLYLLGSSDFSARLAAQLGLPFAFASHFAPDYLHRALEIYRGEFQPSESLARPHAIVGIGLYAAESDDDARRLFTSAQLQGLALVRGFPRTLPPPVERVEFRGEAEAQAIATRTRYAVVGSPETVRRRLVEVVEETSADEFIAMSQIYDHTARLRSYEIGAQIFRELDAVAIGR